jgi:hypothetical protein
MQFLPFVLVRTGGLPLKVLPQVTTSLEEARLAYMTSLESESKQKAELLAAFELYLKENKQETALRKEIYNQRKRLHQGHAVQWSRMDLQASNCSGIAEAQTLLLAAQNLTRNTKIAFEQAHQIQFDTSADQIAEVFAEHVQLRRGLAMSQIEVAKRSKAEILENTRELTTAYRTVARTAAKTSPLSTFGVVQQMSSHSTEAMPWEVRVERFHPNVFFRKFLYSVLMYRPHYFKNIKWRINPSIYPHDNGQLFWVHYSADFQEFIQTSDYDEAMQHLVQVLKLGGNKTMLEWEAYCVNQDALTKEFAPLWLAQAIEIGLLLMTTPEDGLQGSWAKTLLNHLAFMANEAPMSMIQMLNLWTKTSGQLPHMEAPQLTESLSFVYEQSSAYLQEEGIELESFEPQFLYTHDVQLERNLEIQLTDLEPIAEDIAAELAQIGTVRMSRHYAKALQIAQSGVLVPDLHFQDGSTGWSFIAFANEFLQAPKSRLKAIEIPITTTQRIAALVQCYKNADGTVQAVLNALGPGGGRLAGRYLSTFSGGILEDIRNWNTNEADEPLVLSVREVSDSNVNFHPVLSTNQLDWPAPMSSAPTTTAVPLYEVGLRFNRQKTQLELVHISSERQIQLLECGLEARSEKTPMLDLLLQMGIPEWTRDVWKQNPDTITEEGNKHYSRLVSKSGKTILRRERWYLEKTQAETLSSSDFFLDFRQTCVKMAIPRYAFTVGLPGSKPQFIDTHDPLSLVNLQHYLRIKGSVYLEEMSPEPHQLIANDDHGNYVSEYVLELKLDAENGSAKT